MSGQRRDTPPQERWPAHRDVRQYLTAINPALAEPRLLTLVDAAIDAGHDVRDRYGHAPATTKADRSDVTAADLAADATIRRVITASGLFDHTSVLDEESDPVSGTDGDLLVIDPLDGTTNFSMMIPCFAVSLGLFRAGDPSLGVVYDPAARELFVGRKGSGSYAIRLGAAPGDFAHTRLAVTASRSSPDGVHSFCHSNGDDAVSRMGRVFSAMKARTPKYRQFGCAALELCYLASGRLTSFNMTGVHLWDVAAGAVIALEGGARLTDFEGRPFTRQSADLLAATPDSHDALLELIRGALAGRPVGAGA